MTRHRTRKPIATGLVVAIVAFGMFAIGACSSSDETPVPPTPVPTTEPGSPTATSLVATPTSAPSSPTPATPTPDPDDALYIMKMLVSGQVDPNRFPNLQPGEAALLDRAYPGAPALVPHKAKDLVITLEENSCMTCHQSGKTVNGDVAVQIPISHYTDFSTGSVSGEMNSRRYVCTSCHVPQVIDELPAVIRD